MENTKSRGNADFQQHSQSKCDRTYPKRGGLSSRAGNDPFMVDLAIDFDTNSSYHRHTPQVNQTPCVADDDDLEDKNWRELLQRSSSAREGQVQPTQDPTWAKTTKAQDVRGTKLRESLRYILPPWRRGDGKGLLRRRSNQSTAQSPEPVSAATQTTPRQLTPLANQRGANDKGTTCHVAGTGATCLHMTVWLLEDLVSWCDSLDTASVDNLLSNFRDAISACSRIADCERCGGDGSASDNNTILLVTAARYMSTICDSIVRLYVNMHSTYMQNRHDGAHPRLSSPSGIFYTSASGDDERVSPPAKEAHLDGSDSLSKQEQDVTDFDKFLEQLKIKETHRKSNFAYLIEVLDATSKAKEALQQCVSADCGW
ncbi:hypothetical protein G3M48_008748 [Beauveria asiatica]|uniref:Uncharacterized protein n=1 Tax=Beauveria asiatica TaxID=1069075 RepID=A0AAW0RKH5_9HYPO